jgi:DNA-binding transcriptional regulator YdaS (Cro superfamily)
MTNKDLTPVERAAAAVGSMAELARRIGVSRQSVSDWQVKHGGVIPRKRVSAVSEATGIPRRELMPDIFLRD